MKHALLVAITLASSIGFATSSQKVSPRPHKLGIRADFEQNWQRYPAPDAIIQELLSQFPNVSPATIDTACSSLTDDNRSLLGDNSPSTGFASVPTPNSSFISWYSGCVGKVVNMDMMSFTSGPPTTGLQPQAIADLALQFVSKYLGSDYRDACRAITPTIQSSSNPTTAEEAMAPFIACRWAQLPKDVRSSIVSYNLHRHLGPEDVLTDLGLQKNPGELQAKILAFVNKSATDEHFAVDGLPYLIRIQKYGDAPTSSLNVMSATALTKFLILQTAYLKY